MFKALSNLAVGLANNINSGVNAHINRQQALQMQQNQQDFQANQAQLNRDFAANQQLKNMQFAHYMYSNSAQMRMKDLQAAGINPMLATGNNAFTSGGSSGGSSGMSKKTDQTTSGNQPSRGQQKQKISAKNVFVLK